MKFILLAVSLLVNMAFAFTLAWRPMLAPPAIRALLVRHADGSATEAAGGVRAVKTATTRSTKVWTALETDDLRRLISRLREAGFPPAIIREIVRSRVNAHYEPRLRALREPDPTTPFWKMGSTFFSGGDKRYEELNQLQRERAKLLRELFADNFFVTEDVTAAQQRQYGPISRRKIDLIQRIEDDYAEMASAVQAATNGVTLAEDREKLALLMREKRADLAAVLTPDELADYEFRSSPITNFIRNRLGGFDLSEVEFRVLFRAQQALSDKMPVIGDGGGISLQARQEVEREYYQQLRTGWGEARYADYVRETSNDFQQLTRLAERENISRDTVLMAFNLRDSVALESNRVAEDGSLSSDQKQAALRTIAQNTRAQLTTLLGAAAAPAYLKAANLWLDRVEQGNAVTFPDGPGLMVITDRGSVIYSNGPRFRPVSSRRPGL